MTITGQDGQPVNSFADWKQFALPAVRSSHWKEGRSTCELGRCWTASGTPSVPLVMVECLESHADLRGLALDSGFIERETPLPYGSSGPRSHDLMLSGKIGARTAVVCIEAKADESFGATLSAELKKAFKRSPRTRFPMRLNWLSHLLLGRSVFTDETLTRIAPEFSRLQYQLFSAVGGTLLEASERHAEIAVLAVHEFHTQLTREDNVRKNAEALNTFLNLFLKGNGLDLAFQSGGVIGPIQLKARLHIDPPFEKIPVLYICKFVT